VFSTFLHETPANTLLGVVSVLFSLVAEISIRGFLRLNQFLHGVVWIPGFTHIHRHSVTGISLPPVDANPLASFFERHFFHCLVSLRNWHATKKFLYAPLCCGRDAFRETGLESIIESASRSASSLICQALSHAFSRQKRVYLA